MPVVNSVVKSEEGYFCNDFNKKWYVDTGGKYMGFFILQVVIPQCFLIWAPYFWGKLK